MKRIKTSIGLLLIVLMLSLSFNVSAVDTTKDSTRITSGTTGDCTWSYDETTCTLTISGSGTMADYKKGSNTPWCDLDIAKIIINNGVTSIGNHCFERYYATVHSFSTVELPSSITRIGDYAFSSTHLESITIPESVKTIGNYAFYHCDDLKTIKILGAASIGSKAFKACFDLETVTISEKVKSISSNAFEIYDNFKKIIYNNFKKIIYKGTKKQWQKLNNKTSTKSLNEVKVVCSDGSLIIGDSGKVKYTYDINKRVLYFHKGDYKSIDDYELFDSYSAELKAKKVIFEKGVTGFSISTIDFKYVESISISETVSKLWISQGYGGKLNQITVNKKNKKYSSKSGVLFNKKKTVLYNYPGNKKSTKYTIPSSVKTIKEFAFDGSKYLKNVIMKNNVTKLCPQAFRNSSIVEITLSKNLKKIGSHVFADCHRLKKLIVTIQNNKKLYTCTKEILKYRIAGMQMKEIQIGHTLCSPETLKTPFKNQVRQNVQSSVGRGIAKFR